MKVFDVHFGILRASFGSVAVLRHKQGVVNKRTKYLTLTTRLRTRSLTRSPVSTEMSEANCCRVVKKRLSLLNCLAVLYDAPGVDDDGDDEGGGEGECSDDIA